MKLLYVHVVPGLGDDLDKRFTISEGSLESLFKSKTIFRLRLGNLLAIYLSCFIVFIPIR